MTRLLRAAIRIVRSEGLEIVGIAHNKHTRIDVRHPLTGNGGFLTIHLGNHDRSTREASLRSQARSIARGFRKQA